MLENEITQVGIFVGGIGIGIRLLVSSVSVTTNLIKTIGNGKNGKNGKYPPSNWRCADHTNFSNLLTKILTQVEESNVRTANMDKRLEKYTDELFDRMRKAETKIEVLDTIKYRKIM